MTTATAPATAVSPTVRQLWLRSRWFLAGALVLLLAGLLIGGLGDDGNYPALDPRSADPTGARATAQLLRQQGITVDAVSSPAELDGSNGSDTVLLALPDLLTADQLRELAGGRHRRLILLSPGNQALDILAPDVRAADAVGIPLGLSSASTLPHCGLPEAERAGSAELGGRLYSAGPDATGCYARSGYPTLVRTTGPGGGEVVVIGSGRFLTNQRLAHDGNASLALGLLGSQPRLKWYLPDYSAAPSQAQQKSFTELIPSGWSWAALQLAFAALLAAAWRARRLGPVVSEQLPVVVRAAETTEGRARLYQRGRARGRAADTLRRAARRRLAPVLGVPTVAGEPDPTALLAALLGRLSDRREAGEVQALLYGAPPTDDAALLRLADELDALERQVRQP